MKCVAVIPARWDSTRFRGKVLADINGKPMLQHVWERVKHARKVEDVIVAVDKERVFKAVESFGGKAILTSSEHLSGTDRLAEVARSIDADVIVNVQADEPMVNPLMIDELAEVYNYEKNVQMATVIKRITRRDDIDNPNVVKVVVDRKGYALYFSRSPIPFSFIRNIDGQDGAGKVYKHIGLYSYTKDFLFTYTHLPKSSLEAEERLEQLRVLEHGYKIKTIETHCDTISVDTPEDLEKVKNAISVLTPAARRAR